MIIRYLGFTTAGLLFLGGFVLFVIGMYNEMKYSYKSQSPVKPLRSSIRYHLLGALSFGLSLFVFLTTENGFESETLGFSIFLVFLLAFFIGLHHFIQLKTRTYLYKNGVSFASLFEREKKGKESEKAGLGKER
jgi:hypothetical protein